MKLTVLGSSSKGNCYILHDQREALILEAGVKLGLVKLALNFDTNIIQGCLISHEHGDHAAYAHDYQAFGIQVAASQGTINKIRKTFSKYTVLQDDKIQKFGSFTVCPFAVEHDAAEPLGFLINHPEFGNLLFATDCQALPYDFGTVHTYLIEANFSKTIVDERLLKGTINYQQVARTVESHMSLETCIDFLRQQDLRETARIVLLHLSDGNSDAKGFTSQIMDETGNPNVYIADKGLEISLHKIPF